MKKISITEYIKSNEDNLPLAFKKAVIKEKINNSTITTSSKAVKSSFYNDNDFLIFTLYKSISQFL